MGDQVFDLFGWKESIPLTEDIWLDLQAQNLAVVDVTYIRDTEQEAKKDHRKYGHPPMQLLPPLIALSQMWMFSLYEFLRTWRQRAKELTDISDAYEACATEEERRVFLVGMREKMASKRGHVRSAEVQERQEELVVDRGYMSDVRNYFRKTERLFRDSEAMRVTVAKHEVPKTPGLYAETPGLTRMDPTTGAMCWSILLKSGEIKVVNRREIANEFFDLVDDK